MQVDLTFIDFALEPTPMAAKGARASAGLAPSIAVRTVDRRADMKTPPSTAMQGGAVPSVARAAPG
ncbi:hypothetical protein CKO28_10535 [Rhodovibrio sodomensis]|uniref:Uncharacterized protein n=1 Tax=Rhodovibrio sodomensis TaxID=1088 RepID=A0ABS1DDK8_9PROT|nr:hypothetical protein [Rhodovibrio sodomensis]MBK1668470.1 hypothetical protein [Rhodovibrio sodomensis]